MRNQQKYAHPLINVDGIMLSWSVLRGYMTPKSEKNRDKKGVT